MDGKGYIESICLDSKSITVTIADMPANQKSDHLIQISKRVSESAGPIWVENMMDLRAKDSMGIQGLTCMKYIVYGSGQVRS